MKHCLLSIAISLLLFQSVFSQVTAAPATKTPAKKTSEAQKKENPYLRILRDKRDEPIAMQTSIVTFQFRQENKEDIVVDLIGAVHVADKPYFEELNRLFTGYESLLYELVAPEDNNIPTGGKSQHPVGQMQQTMKSMLDLSYQLEEVDYRKKNFVHADMSPEEFSRVMNQRGESFYQMLLRAMGAAMAKQSVNGGSSDAELLFALFAKNRSLRLKRVMSTQFGDLEASMKAIEGENGSTIIGQRNKKCLDVLQRELDKGTKRIGIFYGAGHFPDMEERLAKRFGLYPDEKSVRWLTAWDMDDK